MNTANSLKFILLVDALKLAPGLLSQLLGGFVISTLLARHLSPAQMGIYTLYWIAQSYTVTLFTGWLQNSSIRFLPGNILLLKQFIFITLLTLLLTTTAIVFMSICIANYVSFFNLDYLLLSIAIYTLAAFYSTFQTLFRGLFIQHEFSMNAFLLVCLKILLLILLLPMAENPVYTALMVMAISYLPVVIFQLTMLLRRSAHITRHQSGEPKIESLLKKSFIYGFPLTISLLVMSLMQTGDRYIISTMVPMDDLGMYAFWMMIGLQMGQGLYRILFMALNPRLFKIYSENNKRAKDYIQKLIRCYLLISLPLFTSLACLLPLVLRFVGIKSQYQPASYLIFFSMGMALLLGLAQLCGKGKEFDGQTNIFVYSAISGVVVMVSGVFILTPIAGLVGAATASLCGFVCYFAIIAFNNDSWPAFKDILVVMPTAAFIYLASQLGHSHFDLINNIFFILLILGTYLFFIYKRIKTL